MSRHSFRGRVRATSAKRPQDVLVRSAQCRKHPRDIPPQNHRSPENLIFFRTQTTQLPSNAVTNQGKLFLNRTVNTRLSKLVVRTRSGVESPGSRGNRVGARFLGRDVQLAEAAVLKLEKRESRPRCTAASLRVESESSVTLNARSIL
jgi:hypothetical protein